MASYIYFQHDTQPLIDRFPNLEDIIGLTDWKEYYRDPARLLNKLRDHGSPNHDTSCPRLFVSHRQVDDLYALRMAQLAAQCKFEYWVDVLDPSLRSLNGNPHYTKEMVSILTACIIEMALINCTHVITVMTPGTRGSQWVPYEYGRITEIPSVYERACAWRHPALSKSDLPEYMDLGIIVDSEPQIVNWMNNEYSQWVKKRASYLPDCESSWPGSDQQKLPE